MPPYGHNQDLQSSPGMNSVNRNNNLVKLNNVENIHMNYKDHDNSVKLDNNNSVQLIDDVCDFGISSSCLLADHAGTCVRHYSQNIEDNNVLSFGNCVRPAAVGDTISWTKSKFKDFSHESWFDNFDTQTNTWNNTIFLSDSFGALVGTCTRLFPNMDDCQLVNIQCIQAVFSIYEVSDIFGFGCGHIAHIIGSRDENVNGIYHIYWSDNLKAYVIQRRSFEWGGFMQLIDAFPMLNYT